MSYEPPFRITAAILSLVAEICEHVGRLQFSTEQVGFPELRRNSQVKTIQASLAIEGNTLSLEQVTAVLAGKRVLGAPREIQEVKNAFDAYSAMDDFEISSLHDLFDVHKLMMQTLIDEYGRFRSGGVGIKRGDDVVHIAPPADLVHAQIQQLLDWLAAADLHPFVASSVFHYEFEFIHPFQDGDGRVGRFWQTLILSNWNPLFSILPIASYLRRE